MLRAYLAVFAGTGLATAVLSDPSLDSERRKPGPEEIHPNSRRAATVLFLATVVIAALDVGRFHWTTLGEQIQMVALAALSLAASLLVWSIMVNPFFSTVVRVQCDRGHKLVTCGPYRFVRHPGYLAMMTIMPATALAIGSIAAVIPASCYSALILWRTKREDRFLTDQLPGYAEYRIQARDRLVPGLW